MKKSTPAINERYLNRNGCYYDCIGHDAEGRAIMRSVSRWPWVFIACDCRIYDNGAIDWAYSIKGHFEQ